MARIMVGVDGSDESQRALERTAASPRWGTRLIVVHAWRFGVSPSDQNTADAARSMGRAAQHVEDDEVEYARTSNVDVKAC